MLTCRSITTSTMSSQEQDGEDVGEELEEEVGEEVGEKDRDFVGEAGEEVGQTCGDKIAVQPVPCFELCYEDKIKARVFAEIIFTEDGLGFVPFVMNQFAFVSWLLRCTGLRKHALMRARTHSRAALHVRDATQTQHALVYTLTTIMHTFVSHPTQLYVG